MKAIKSAVGAITGICLVFCALKFTLPSYIWAGNAPVKQENSIEEYGVGTVTTAEKTAYKDAATKITDEKITEQPSQKSQSEVLQQNDTDTDLLKTDNIQALLQPNKNEEDILPVADSISSAESGYVVAAPKEEKAAENPLEGLLCKSEIKATPGTQYAGMLNSASEMRIYNFTVNTRSYINYSVEHDALSDLSSWRVYLFEQYSKNGTDEQSDWRLLNVLDSTQDSKSDASSNIGVLAGNYRVVVTSGKVFKAHIYRLTINVTESCEYEIECNDAITRYTEIASGSTVKGSASYFEGAKDSDWYLINVYSPGFISLNFEHPKGEPASVCFKVTVYDINLNELYSNNSFFATEKLSAVVGINSSYCFVEVRSIVYADFDYKLTVTRTVQNNFESEPNNSTATADKITIGTAFDASINEHSVDTDIDYFSFTLSDNGYVTVNFSHVADAVTDNNDDAKDGWRIRLTDKNGNLLWLQTSQWTDSGKVSPEIGLSAGTYYISVDSNGLYFSPRVYSVKVDFTLTNDWEKEYNNLMTLSTPIIEYYAYSASLTESGTDYDTDWFSFTLDTPKRVNVLLSHEQLPTDRNIFVYSLYSADGTRLTSENIKGEVLFDDANNPVQLILSRMNTPNVSAFYTLNAGTYYIKVTSGTYYSNMRYNISYSEITE